MSFRSFIVLMGVALMVASVVFGYLTFTSSPNYGAGCLVLAVAGALFLVISRIGNGGS